MGNFKNSPLSKVLNNKTNLVEILLVAIIIAFGTNIIASGIVSLSFWDNKMFMVIGFGILFVAIAFIYLIKPMFRNREYNKKITANIVYDKEKQGVTKIKNYKYSEKVYDYLEYAFIESEDIKAIWNSNNQLNTSENNYEKSKSMQLIEEATEYNLLDTVSKHLNSYFNSEYISKNNITIIDRDDISEIVTKNKFLDLFSKPKEERSVYLKDKIISEKKTSNGQASSKKRFHKEFELKVPENSKLKREKDGSISIENKRFILNFKVDFTGKPSSEIPPDYLKTFHQLDEDEYNQYEIDVKINIEFLKNTFLSNKSWEYYNWLDSLISKIEDDFCPIKFKEKINWKSNQLILNYLQNQMTNPEKLVKNKKTYLFYANVKTKGKIWSRSIENSYSKNLLQSDNAKLAVDELVNQEKSGNIENIDVLGVYYKGDDSEVVSKLKIESFTENSVRVDFDFINLEETPITTGALSKIIGEDYGYYLDGENQFIICFEENIDELLKRSQK